MMEIKKRLKSKYLELLFVCLCLLTVLGPANGETVVRVDVGSEAVLPCLIRPERDIRQKVFDWKKDGQKEVFLYAKGQHYNNGRHGQDDQFKGRVFHFPDQLQSGDASILINNTKLSDSGTYSCDYAPDEVDRQTYNIKLVVCILKDQSKNNIPGAYLKPHITSLNHRQDKAQLQCEVHGAFPKPKVKWQDSSGNILPAEEPQVTERDGSYDIFLQTTVTKTDKFRCVVTQEEICHQVSAETTVYIHGAATEVCVTILEETKDWSLLQCEVRGASPKPDVNWQDSSGNILPAEEPEVTERGGSYDIIVKITVTEADRYHCVVTQEEIKDRPKAEIYVHIGDSTTGLAASTGVFAALFVAVALVMLFIMRHKIQRCINGSQTETERDEEKNSCELVELKKPDADQDPADPELQLTILRAKCQTSM